MNYILCFFFLMTIFACQHGTSKSLTERQSSSKFSPQQQKLNTAKNLHDIGDHHAAIAQLRFLIDTAAYSSLIDEAYLLMVEWLLEVRRDSEAKRWASQFFKKHKDSPYCNKIIALFDQRPPQINIPSVTEMSEEPREVASTNDNLFLDFNDVMSNKADYETSKSNK